MRTLFCALVIFVTACSEHSSVPEQFKHYILTGERPFNVEAFRSFSSIDEVDFDACFSNRWAILIYYSALSCTTCQEREIRHLNEWFTRYHECMSFYLVTHGAVLQNLMLLKRVGRVRYPILLEPELGTIGFSEVNVTIALVDQVNQTLVAMYTPQSAPELSDGINYFEKVVLDIAGEELGGCRAVTDSTLH